MVLRGKLPCKAKFSRPGGRASGDFNTGMGNTLIMSTICIAVLRRYGVRFDLLVDGDNALVFLDGKTSGPVLENFASDVLDECGHEFVLERPVRVLEEVRFGRSAPVRLGGNLGLTMVRDVMSVLSGSSTSHRYLREPKYAREWLAGVSMCELSLALGVPVLQAWASNTLRIMDFSGKLREEPFREYLMLGAHFAGLEECREISPVARASFCDAFGITPEHQVVLEEGFSRLEMPRLDDWRVIDPHHLQDLPPGLSETFLDDYV